MAIELKTPLLPESVADATIVVWHKKAGEHVMQDENLVDLETDKVVLEVPAPISGVLDEIVEDVGAVVTSGQLLGKLVEGDTPTQQIKAPSAEELEAAAPAETADTTTTAASSAAASPSVRQAMYEKGVGKDKVSASGEKGRITHDDVDRASMTSAGIPALPITQGMREERRVPMTRLRARIAERLLESQQQSAILTTFNEVDMSAVMSLRTKYKEQFQKTHGVKLGFMSFFARAAAEALKQYPEVNASIEGDDIIYHGYYDIGVAVSSKRGLVVPILRDVDGMSMADIEKQIADYGERAQRSALTMDELTGGTFTLSNGGVFGSLLSTPIINPPQSGILGMHKIEKRAVVVDDEVVVRPMMYLALSYDHRIIDGSQAVGFLVAIKNAIEEPARILLDM